MTSRSEGAECPEDMTTATPERDEAMAQPTGPAILCSLCSESRPHRHDSHWGLVLTNERSDPHPAPPDATLDGLLLKRDEAVYHFEVARANEAIRAYVERWKLAGAAYQRDSDKHRALWGEARAEIARLREALVELAERAEDTDPEDVKGPTRLPGAVAAIARAALASPPPATAEPTEGRDASEIAKACREFERARGHSIVDDPEAMGFLTAEQRDEVRRFHAENPF